MLRKVLYGVGGIIGLFILIGILAPPPEPAPIQIQQAPAVVQQQTTVEAEESKSTATTSELEKKSTKPAQPTIEQPKQTLPAPVQVQSQFQYYTVIEVVDGDTLKINMGDTAETLRLIGIDTPETVDPRKPVQCFGVEASNRAKDLVLGQKIRVEADSTQDTRDKYGRLLVYVYRDDGLFFNRAMVADGYAYEYTYDKAYKYQAEFRAAQLAAQSAGKGLWSPDACNDKANFATQSSGSRYYTSSHSSAKYYYPESCDGWQGLSEKYLKSFDTLEALLAQYDRDLSPQCQ